MLFDSLAKIEIVAIVVGSFFGISLAILRFGVWSLVYQSLAVTTITTILLWITIRWRPKLIFSWGEIKLVSSYSLHLSGFNIFNYFARNADYLLIGKFLGTESLGYYTLAYRLMLYPLQNISGVLGRVMLPIFSQVQNDNERFCRAYLEAIATIAFVSFPLMFGLCAVSEAFIITFFGSQWQPVILLLIILAPVGMIQSVGTTVGTIYILKGRTDLMFRWGTSFGIFIILAILVGLQWGITGVATAYAIANVALVYPLNAIPFKLIDLHINEAIEVLWKPLIASSIMSIVLITLKAFLSSKGITNSWLLLNTVFIGLITYLMISWCINKKQMQKLFVLLKPNNR